MLIIDDKYDWLANLIFFGIPALLILGVIVGLVFAYRELTKPKAVKPTGASQTTPSLSAHQTKNPILSAAYICMIISWLAMLMPVLVYQLNGISYFAQVIFSVLALILFVATLWKHTTASKIVGLILALITLFISLVPLFFALA